VPSNDQGLEQRNALVTALSRASRSRILMIALAAVVVLAVAGSTWGYSRLSKTVTVSLDGQSQEVTAFGGTVGDVLEAEGIEVSERDIVVPSLDEQVSDGTKIAVQFARPFQLEVDGESETHWVTATTVSEALEEVGRLYSDADLSASRGGSIDRGGMTLSVVTPKTLKVKLAGDKVVKRTVTALTVEEALDELGVELGKHDETVPPRPTSSRTATSWSSPTCGSSRSTSTARSSTSPRSSRTTPRCSRVRPPCRAPARPACGT